MKPEVPPKAAQGIEAAGDPKRIYLVVRLLKWVLWLAGMPLYYLWVVGGYFPAAVVVAVSWGLLLNKLETFLLWLLTYR